MEHRFKLPALDTFKYGDAILHKEPYSALAGTVIDYARELPDAVYVSLEVDIPHYQVYLVNLSDLGRLADYFYRLYTAAPGVLWRPELPLPVSDVALQRHSGSL